MLVNLAVKKVSISLRLEGKECLSEASGESGGGLLDTLFSSGNFGSISRVEVIDGLFRSELGDRWKDREGIAGQEDDVLGVSADSRDLSVIDELQRIRSSSVFSNGSIMIVNFSAGFLQHNVLQNSSEPDSTVDFRLFLLAKSDTLGIASTFDVENTLVSPDVLIVADKFAISDGTKSSFTSSRESEEEANITSSTDIAAGMKREMSLLGHQVVHDGENTLFHFSCVLRSKDNHLSLLEVQ